jgi:hypothetical protein
MRRIITQKPRRWPLLWTPRVLLVAAVSMLAYSGFVLMDTRIFQKTEHRQPTHHTKTS